MTTRRTKRWNGELSSLSIDYLKEVSEKINAYGVAVQFELPGHSKAPIYHIINPSGRKIGFDGKHLLHDLNENGLISDQLSAEFSLEQLQESITAPAVAPRRARKSSGSGTGRKTAAAVAAEQIEVAKYQYFREHREQLPAGIQKYADAISTLMINGLSAEEAFNTIIEQHFS